MNRVVFKLNSAGVQELLKSSEMQSILRQYANRTANSAGNGYSSEVKVYTKRAVGRVFPETEGAVGDNFRNNTLLKALGG